MKLKSKVTQSNKSLILILMFALSALAQNAFASTFPTPPYSLPGIPTSGAPGFTNSAEINLFNLGGNSFLFAASNAGAPLTFELGSHSVTSSSARFLVTAEFMADGSYIQNTGTLTVSGSIPFISSYAPYTLPGVYISGDLLTAKLDNFAFNSDLLGFSTSLLTGFGSSFGTNESVYFSTPGIASALGFGTNPGLHATTNPILANTVTSVPLPAAVWLFMSGLALLGLRRKAV
jgi:hypothetical protein